MAWQQTDLDALDAALKACRKRVKYKDQEVEYQSVDDMLKVRALMRNELGFDAGQGGSVISAGRIEC